MVPQDGVGVGHGGIVGNAVTGDDDFSRGIFRHLLYVLRLHIPGQIGQQQVAVAHGIFYHRIKVTVDVSFR